MDISASSGEYIHPIRYGISGVFDLLHHHTDQSCAAVLLIFHEVTFVVLTVRPHIFTEAGVAAVEKISLKIGSVGPVISSKAMELVIGEVTLVSLSGLPTVGAGVSTGTIGKVTLEPASV